MCTTPHPSTYVCTNVRSLYGVAHPIEWSGRSSIVVYLFAIVYMGPWLIEIYYDTTLKYGCSLVATRVVSSVMVIRVMLR